MERFEEGKRETVLIISTSEGLGVAADRNEDVLIISYPKRVSFYFQKRNK